eukprot:1653940-Pleurochrysis_carterae.AAC.1
MEEAAGLARWHARVTNLRQRLAQRSLTDRRFPAAARSSTQHGRTTLAGVPLKYRLEETALLKVIIAMNNPTPIHTDYANAVLTCILCFDVNDDTCVLQSGHHVLLDVYFCSALVFQDSRTRQNHAHWTLRTRAARECGDDTWFTPEALVLQQ